MIVGVSEARRRFIELMQRVHEGQSVTITRHGKAVAQLGPPNMAQRQVRFGTMRGQIHFKPGWDAPIDLDRFLAGEF